MQQSILNLDRNSVFPCLELVVVDTKTIFERRILESCNKAAFSLYCNYVHASKNYYYELWGGNRKIIVCYSNIIKNLYIQHLHTLLWCMLDPVNSNFVSYKMDCPHWRVRITKQQSLDLLHNWKPRAFFSIDLHISDTGLM